jgi:hypothetical protein
LIQAEKVLRVVLCFYGAQALPSISICLWDAVAFVATHEVHIDPGDHSGLQLAEEVLRPGYVGRIVIWFGPVAQDVDDERRTSIAKSSLIRWHSAWGCTEIP